MGKLILVSGENSSGKSIFAKEIVSKLSGKRYYIATMIPKTANNYLRIEKHKRQREGLGFTTLELGIICGVLVGLIGQLGIFFKLSGLFVAVISACVPLLITGGKHRGTVLLC